MEPPSDRELWDEAASGSDSAFGALFERHASSVYNYCFRRTADWAAAEDLMAATFLEAWRRRDEVRLSGDSLRPWLFGVATNLMRNQRRSNRRRDAALERIRVDSSGDAFADEVGARIDDERRMQELIQLISAMPQTDRDVISLVLWAGLSYDEAAIALDVPIGTIKSRVSRARRRLKELTANSGHDSHEGRALARASDCHPGEVEG